MTFKGHLASLIAHINNGIKLKKFYVYSKNFPYSENFLRCLLDAGYIGGYKSINGFIYVYLKYGSNLKCALPGLKYVSRVSGRRYFKKHLLIPNGIYSTVNGIKLGVHLKEGGELLAHICHL